MLELAVKYFGSMEIYLDIEGIVYQHRVVLFVVNFKESVLQNL